MKQKREKWVSFAWGGILLTILILVLTSCSCFSQLPTQYIYVDEDCSALLPDYRGMVIVTDNCQVSDVVQEPEAGQIIAGGIEVKLTAMDLQGNLNSMTFLVTVLDTIAPLMIANPDWVGYTDSEIGSMYKAYYAWVQDKGLEYNDKVAGKIDTIQLPDTTLYHTYDTMRIFYGTIPIYEYRIDEGYWANETPDLTAWFK